MPDQLDLYDLRRREVQALGAALSCRNWHMMETAYNSLRDKLDRAGFTVAGPRSPTPSQGLDAATVEPQWCGGCKDTRTVDCYRPKCPMAKMDAATVERCAQVADRLASTEDEALQHAKNEAPADRARIAVIAAEFRRAAKVIRGLAKEKPDA